MNHSQRSGGNQRQSQMHTELEAVFKPDKLSNMNYVEYAEKVIKQYKTAYERQDNTKKKKTITTTQLRNLFALMTELREIVRIRRHEQNSEQLSEVLVGRVQYVKMRFVYAAGKAEQQECDVRDFMKVSGLIECLDTIKASPAQLELVCKYMEALVAYHKFYLDNK